MFPEGDFPKISSCFLTFFEKIEQKKHRGYLRLSLRIYANFLQRLLEYIMYEVLQEINIA